MLTRKPIPGETIRHQDGRTFQVVSVVGNLCWFRHEDGATDCFIWQFHDGLNRLFSHA